jgi:hypothetical protein
LTPDVGARVAPAFGVLPLDMRYLYPTKAYLGARESLGPSPVLPTRRSPVNRLSRSLVLGDPLVNKRHRRCISLATKTHIWSSGPEARPLEFHQGP